MGVGGDREVQLLEDARDVFLDAAGKPVPDPSSGLFCPYNPGTTTVTVTTGGLSYAVPVTVQAGSVRLPCGTVAVRTAAVMRKVPTPPPPPPPPPPVPVSNHQPPPVVPRVPHLLVPVSTSLPSPPPPAARVAPPSAPTPRPAALPAVPPGRQGVLPPPRILVPVAPPAVRPLPPTGFGTVPSGVPLSARAVEREKKKEEAVESARNDFAVYRPDDGSVTVTGVALLLLVVAGGLSGAQLRRRSRPRGAAAYVRTDVRPPRRW